MSPTAAIARVAEDDLADVLPLFRAYCDFYGTMPTDEALLALCRALVADREHEGLQLVARTGDGRAVGFATLYWLWSSTRAIRIGLMNDLYVAPEARGTGVADALVDACAREAATHGARALEWSTAPDNARAQAVYVRTGAARSEWMSYELALSARDGGTAPAPAVTP